MFWNHTAVSLTAFRRLQDVLRDYQNCGKCTIKTVINSHLLKCCCGDIRAISTWYNLKACHAMRTLRFSTFTAKIVSKEAEVHYQFLQTREITAALRRIFVTESQNKQMEHLRQ